LAAGTGELVRILQSRVKLRQLPHLIWEFDATEREAGKIEKLIAGIDENDEDID
jgi:ribosome-binding factor A